jgi:phosphoribosylaminoimidazolecarboxamide formyltransferase/IMP cyclohydrolase
MTDDGKIAVRRALISVSNKTGLIDLACGLDEANVEIVSTGGTATALREAGIPVTLVRDVTEFPEILGGRVKTMHPRILGGVLGVRSDPEHTATLKRFDIRPFELIICTLYPFEQTVDSGADADECVEQIDIGGPTMLRSGAKNFASVAVVTDPNHYSDVLRAVKSGGFTLEQRLRYSAEAFQHTAEYDIEVATWMSKQAAGDGIVGGLSPWMATVYDRPEQLGYGENPHQKAVVYHRRGSSTGIANAQKLGGKPTSFNNYGDVSWAWRTALGFNEPCVAIIKHASPCGIATGMDAAEAHRKAHACDPLSAFGGVIAVNRELTVELAKQIVPIFTEVVAAPSYEPEALEVLKTKENLRILQVTASDSGIWESKQIDGGLLVQTVDMQDQPGDNPSNWTLMAGDAFDPANLAEAECAWRGVRWIKSNGILLWASGASVGIGAGQPNRVDSCRDAVRRAGTQAEGSILASDAYFPYPDGPQVAIEAGVRAIVQPGGSIRDDETVELCREHGVTLYFTGVRHFAH